MNKLRKRPRSLTYLTYLTDELEDVIDRAEEQFHQDREQIRADMLKVLSLMWSRLVLNSDLRAILAIAAPLNTERITEDGSMAVDRGAPME